MSDITTDVVVVGAGPAGIMAAWELARRGVAVTVVERKQEIGTPKRCAEGLALEYLEPFGISPDPRWALNRITGAIVYSPSGKRVVVDTGAEGYIVERKIFEKYLARKAIEAGARFMVKTQVTGLIKTDGVVSGVTFAGMDGEGSIPARLVIGADGVDSKVGTWAGITGTNDIGDYHSGFQYEMAGLTGIEEGRLHIFFGGGNSPGGYIWIFPKGEGVANVGIGISAKNSKEGARAKDYLDRFIGSHPGFFEKASYLEVNSGGIPMSPSKNPLVADGVILVGDAAHQVNPIHGGGIGVAMGAARIAAEVAAEVLATGDVSAEKLSVYEQRWDDLHGGRLKKLLKLRYFFEKLGSDELEKMADFMDGGTINDLTNGNFGSFFKKAFVKSPKLIPLARKFLS